MRHRWATWAVALCGAAMCVGGMPVAWSSASAASSGGGTKVVLTKYGFSVTLPSGWKKVTLTKAGIDRMAKYIDKADPSLGQLFTQNEATARHLQLYAIGPLGGSSLPNMNVLVQSPQGLPSGNSFVSQAQGVMKGELQQEGFKNVAVTVAHLPFGTAVEGQYSLPGTGATVTQFYMSRKGHLYIVTVSPPSVVSQIVNTWHWL